MSEATIVQPARTRPTDAELEEAVSRAASINLYKHYKGRPPRGMSWEDLQQEIILRTLKRLRNFTHGGRKTLSEFSYFAAYCALMDICRAQRFSPRETNLDLDSA
jgi:DNA-directed RNA polymerase specialized sigma24 family protein